MQWDTKQLTDAAVTPGGGSTALGGVSSRTGGTVEAFSFISVGTLATLEAHTLWLVLPRGTIPWK
jgi:hypothetical protein